MACVRCGIKQAVQVHDEVAHLGVVDGFARLAKPGLVGFRVVRKKSDHIQLREILEINILDVMELAAKDEMNQLFRQARVFSQGFFMLSLLAQVPGNGQSFHPAGRRVCRRFEDEIIGRLKRHEHVAQISGNGDFTDRKCQLPIFNPEAGSAPAVIAGHHVDAVADKLGNVEPLFERTDHLLRAELPRLQMKV